MILFDSHAHINAENYSEAERTALKDRIEASTVAYVVDIGFDIPSSRIAMRNAMERSWCFAAVGVHPHDAKTLKDDDLNELRSMLDDPSVVALGEIGLDFHYDHSPRDVQREVFRKQLRVALDAGVPVTIHDRESAGETIEILKDEGAFSNDRRALFPKNPVTGIADARILLHCFSGSAEQAIEYIDLGCTISIAGPVTYKNNKKTVLVVQEIPVAHMLIETDSPYLTPEPLRGKPNESPNVEYVCRKIAELRGVSPEEIADVTTNNALRFYNLSSNPERSEGSF